MTLFNLERTDNCNFSFKQSEHGSDPETCFICQGEVGGDASVVVQTACRHLVHHECAKGYLAEIGGGESSISCGMCRKPLSGRVIYKSSEVLREKIKNDNLSSLAQTALKMTFLIYIILANRKLGYQAICDLAITDKHQLEPWGNLEILRLSILLPSVYELLRGAWTLVQKRI